jgi:anti-sigma factor RsiW
MSDARRGDTKELYALLDGELAPWHRWLARRRLARDPAARRELDSVAEIGALLREQAASAGEPDLWQAVRARLPYAEQPAAAGERAPARAPWLPACVGAGLATAAVAAVMATGLLAGDAPAVGSVRWLDSRGKPVMVLQDDRDATIIWVIERPKKTSGGGGGAVA